jgi:hypothetical protein
MKLVFNFAQRIQGEIEGTIILQFFEVLVQCKAVRAQQFKSYNPQEMTSA